MYPSKIEDVVDKMVEEGTQSTTTGNWLFYFRYWAHDYHISTDEDVVEQIVDELEQRNEVLEVELDTDCLDVMFSLEYCPNVEE